MTDRKKPWGTLQQCEKLAWKGHAENCWVKYDLDKKYQRVAPCSTIWAICNIEAKNKIIIAAPTLNEIVEDLPNEDIVGLVYKHVGKMSKKRRGNE